MNAAIKSRLITRIVFMYQFYHAAFFYAILIAGEQRTLGWIAVGLRRKEPAMKRETTGTVISVSKQWWLKVNTKAIRKGTMDGAVFPHIIKVTYSVDGEEYSKRKWISAGAPVPAEGSSVKVIFEDGAPNKAEIVY